MPVTRFLPDTSRNLEQDMAYVGYRLATLGALPTTFPVSRLKIADAGFYYQGDSDEVVCYRCQARHRGWTNADNPFVVHRRISPQCQHLAHLSVEPAAISAVHNDVTDSSARHRTIFSGLDTDNTEDGEPRVSTGQPQSVSIDETGNTEDGEPRLSNGQPQSVSIDETGNNTQMAATGHSATSQGATSRSGAPGQATVVRTMFPSPALDLGGAVYPMYQDMASRRRSFVNWNETRAPPLEEILLNGMFYAGYADCVRCFYCGVGLKSWEPTDNVWSEHIRWRPNCRYLQAIKGEDYIRRVVTQLNREGDGEDLREAVSTVRSDNFVLPARPSITTPLTTATISTSSSTPVPAASQPALASSLSSPTSQLAATATIQPETTAATGLSQEQRNNVDRVEEDGEARPSRISVVPPNEENESERLSRLRQENRELAGRLQCRVCHRRSIDTIFLPCGHLMACEECTGTLRECPQCHEYIQATARVHMA